MFRRMRAWLKGLPGSASATPPASPVAVPAQLPDSTAGSLATDVLAPPGGQADASEDVARAHELLARGKVNQAIALVQTRMREGPNLELASTLGDLQVVQRANRRLARRPDDAKAHLELGRALFALEQGHQALDHLVVACHRRPDWLEAHLLTAYELHWEGRWQEAERAYAAVLTLHPGHLAAQRGLVAVRACQPPHSLLTDADDGSLSGSAFR